MPRLFHGGPNPGGQRHISANVLAMLLVFLPIILQCPGSPGMFSRWTSSPWARISAIVSSTRRVPGWLRVITSAVVSLVRYTDTSPWGPPWRKTLLMGLWFPSASWVTSAGRTLRMTVRSAAKGWKLLTDWWTLVVYSCSASISLFPKVSSSAVVI